jgi:capsular polysaccharide export protein
VNSFGSLAGKNILLLQGPVGLFFKKLGKQFQNKGANVFRIGLNAGDSFFSSSHQYTPYKDTPENWQKFVFSFLQEKKIDKIFLFGDCRFYQSIAVAACDALGVEIYVFEEGYLRPHYITLEKHGVNDYSHISRDPKFYKDLEEVQLPTPEDATPNAISNWSIVITYYFMARLFRLRYPHYQHHRNFSALEEFFFGTRSLMRKVFYTKRDKKYLPKIQNELSKQYFFVPLQTHNDFQILQHSEYGTIEKFIIEVLESFAKHTKDELLIFKHHPIDRGRKNFTEFILEQSTSLFITHRILVVHDLHLPTLLNHTKGTITINSTVGLSSILHGTATIALGKAIYNIEGLVYKDMALDNFWTQGKAPDPILAKKFKQHLILTTQLNGSFYGRMPDELK